MRVFILALFFLGYLQAHVVTPEVFAAMQKRLEKNSQDVEALIICSHYYENKGEYPKAIDHIQKALDIMKQPASATPDLYIRMAQMHVNTEQFSEALTVFNQLLTKEFCQTYGHIPPILHAILWRGKVYAALGKNERAWQDVQFVLEREQEMPAFFVEGARIAEKLGQNLKAFELYAKVATQFPSPESEPSVVRAIGLVKKQPQNAAELLQKLEKLLPKEPYPSFYLAIVAKKYLDDDDLYEQKLQQVAKIAREMSDKSLQFFWLARVFYIQEKYTKALECIDKSIAADKRPAAAYELAAAIYEKQGNKDAASKNRQTSLEMRQKSTYQWLFFYEID
ncbi:tetratricopeptide repeat protein [Candidatus Uabimicrobium amorphum]|uniref:Photosystem I assembly protein Ycf3 n=1 Tax=Uabimicrobium amorphum TaxID=2596890 RepID=A0A5S9IRB7_UABAM|nr:tetratricopeptide repeat protein [Candidatus Uabimicrobium amorphum]BBM86693.1 Photosystem I assembly protein Ycf3 [Candidatus Uabimicrobium amorphum]